MQVSDQEAASIFYKQSTFARGHFVYTLSFVVTAAMTAWQLNTYSTPCQQNACDRACIQEDAVQNCAHSPSLSASKQTAAEVDLWINYVDISWYL